MMNNEPNNFGLRCRGFESASSPKIGTRPWPGQSELTLRIITSKQEQVIGNGSSTLALKAMGRVTRSPIQIVPVTPQNCFCKIRTKTYLPLGIYHCSDWK